MAAMRRSIDELVWRARTTADVGEFATHALATYETTVRYDRALITRKGGHEPLVSVGVDRHSLEIVRYCQQNLDRYAPDLRKALAFARRTGGFIDSEVYSARDRRELPFFCDIVHPQRVRSSLVLTPRWQGTDLGTIRLERDGRLPFTPRDFARAVALLPVIEVCFVAHGLTAHGAGGAPDDRALPQLSAREAEVARHVGRGLATRQIALLLGTSPFTVRNQLSRIFDKLGIANRAELAAWVTRELAPRPAAAPAAAAVRGTSVP